MTSSQSDQLPSNVRAAAAAFEAELEHFRKQAEGVVQFLASYLTIHNVAARDRAVHRMLSSSALHWNTTLGALQQSAFITLGRIFDQKSEHNIDRLIQLAQAKPTPFSKDALRARKRGTSPEPPEWLDQRIAEAYEPTTADFRELRKEIRKRRSIYESNYRALRNEFFAHSETIDSYEVDALFARTNIGELQELLDFACALHGALWALYFNGTRPKMTLSKDAASPMRKLYERMQSETEALLRKLTEARPGLPP
jgi:hypothetical protein